MGQADGLGRLHVRAPRKDGVLILHGLFAETGDEFYEEVLPLGEAVGNEEPEGESHLVIAASARMQAFADLAHDFREPGLDVHVHVLEFGLPDKGAFPDFTGDLIKALHKSVSVLPADDALAGQHAGVSLRATDILGGKIAIVGFGFGVGRYGLRGALFEASAPARVGFFHECVRAPRRGAVSF